MGHKTKTLLQTSHKLLQPKIISPRAVQNELRQRKERQKYLKPLDELNSGNQVMDKRQGQMATSKSDT